MDKNFEMSRFAEGITNVEKARVLEVENTFTYQNELNERLCLANSKLKKTEEAFTTCNATLALNPKNIEAMVIRSELWQEQGEFQNAIDDLKVADEVRDPHSPRDGTLNLLPGIAANAAARSCVEGRGRVRKHVPPASVHALRLLT